MNLTKCFATGAVGDGRLHNVRDRATWKERGSDTLLCLDIFISVAI